MRNNGKLRKSLLMFFNSTTGKMRKIGKKEMCLSISTRQRESIVNPVGGLSDNYLFIVEIHIDLGVNYVAEKN